MLSYKNESDRCFGATGMAIGLVVFDGEDMVARISIDQPPHAMVEMNEDFFFTGNPSLSAKTAWSRMVRNFHLMVAMMIGNVMCRRMVSDKADISADLHDALRSRIIEEALDSCSLEEDEADRLFEKDYAYLYRVFNHRGVQDVARDFADALSRERSFSRGDILDHLRALSML